MLCDGKCVQAPDGLGSALSLRTCTNNTPQARSVARRRGEHGDAMAPTVSPGFFSRRGDFGGDAHEPTKPQAETNATANMLYFLIRSNTMTRWVSLQTMPNYNSDVNAVSFIYLSTDAILTPPSS
jgi:hypothetical protein